MVVTLPISLLQLEASGCRGDYKNPVFLQVSNLPLYKVRSISLPKVQIGTNRLPEVQSGYGIFTMF
jgi:hypothetical protein